MTTVPSPTNGVAGHAVHAPPPPADEDGRPIARDVASSIPEALLRRVSSVSDAELREPPAPREYLLHDVRLPDLGALSTEPVGALDARGVALLVSAGGIGKTYVTSALALAVATGTDWLGAFRPARPGRVLIISAEEPAAEVRRRLHHVALSAGSPKLAHSIDVVDLHDAVISLVRRRDDGALDDSGSAWSLRNLAEARGPYSLVVVDPLGRVAGAPIDQDNIAAAAVIGALEGLASAADGLVIACHHTSKWARREGVIDATAARGATGLVDYARGAMILVAEGEGADETITLASIKANHFRRWPPLLLRRAEHGQLVPLSGSELRERADDQRRRTPEGRAEVRAEERRNRDVEDDNAVRQVLAREPAITVRALRAAVRSIRTCSTERACDAIARVRGRSS